MNSKTTLSISEARKRIFEIAEEVQKPGVQYTLTENGTPKVVLLSVAEFESMAETMEVSGIFPELDKDIQEGRRDYNKGDYITLAQLLAKDGYVLAEKPKKKYEVSRHIAKKSAKRSR